MKKKDFLLIGFFFVASIIALFLNMRTESKIKGFVRNDNQNRPNGEALKISTKTENQEINGTIFDIIQKNEPLRCIYTKEQDGITKSNTVYTDGSSARSNTKTKSVTQEIQVNTIIKKDIVYMWQPGDTQGMQMDLNLYKEKSNASGSNIGTEPMQLEEMFDFECGYWQANPSMFETPYGLEFLDITDALFKINETPCLICDSMTDPKRKAECRTSLKCK